MDRGSSRPCGNVGTRVVCGFPSSEGAARKADPSSALATLERHFHRESSVSAHFRENLLVWHQQKPKELLPETRMNTAWFTDSCSEPIIVKKEEVNSTCCSAAENQTCSLPSGKPGVCPNCRTKGKAVSTLTVKSLVQDHAAVPAAAQFSFCRTPDCEVVYFSDQVLFKKPDLKVRVGIKETTDPVPLCYCFEYNGEDIRRDMDATGNTTILEKIKAEVQGGFCACEVKNPSGACCLGDITRAIQEIKRQSSQPVAAPIETGQHGGV